MNYNINGIKLKELPIELIQLTLQNEYDQDFQKAISFQSSIGCTSCGSKDFKSHGSYERNVYLNTKLHIYLNVMRKMCLSCGKTRVYLPSYLVKYKRYTVQYLFKLIHKISKTSLNHVHKKLKHSLGYLSYLYNQYLRHHRLRVRSLFSKKLKTFKTSDMEVFLHDYRQHHRLQFLQIKRE
ncbi:MAG TPA: DUF6431 domain-containing protein [Erysipelothrix sp.]|nr:DUF6431 domain-containing protein [Erysipelothrix sp.]